MVFRLFLRLGLFQGVDGGLKLVHGLLESGARSSHIQSHVAIARNAIYFAIIETKMCFLGEETHQFGMIKP